jgi:uncharacterized Zn finger protein (UPF0148 family)
MFCPKCAANLVQQDGELKCSASKMGFSRGMERALSDRYGSHIPSANRGIPSSAPQRWYCPGCGVVLDSEMRCPSCHLSLQDLRYQLVEMHPHKKW